MFNLKEFLERIRNIFYREEEVKKEEEGKVLATFAFTFPQHQIKEGLVEDNPSKIDTFRYKTCLSILNLADLIYWLDFF